VRTQLAQYNIAHLRRPLDHAESASYVALLDEVNARAEASPGFVWRHGIDSRDSSTSVYDDPLTLVNMSVWESPGHLRDYAYRGFHRDVFRRRLEWFDASGAVMWWIPEGSIPSLAEGVERLEFLRRHGPTPYGFETGQQFEQLVVCERDPDDAQVRAAVGDDRIDGPVHLALVDGEPVGAARATGSDVVTWIRPGDGRAWLAPALQVHALVHR
jgi:hypothetical protein